MPVVADQAAGRERLSSARSCRPVGSRERQVSAVSGLSLNGRLDGQRHKPEVPVRGRSRRPAFDPLQPFKPRRPATAEQRLLPINPAARRTALHQ